MSDSLDVLAIVGSLRRESYTRRLAQALAHVAPPSLAVEIAGVGDLPLYNEDEESTVAAWAAFRARAKRADAILFATPEYNRTIPGGLKNAIDVGSRPYGQSVWAGKPAAVISTSPGAMGAFGANHQLRQALVFLDMPTMQQPEAYLGGVDHMFDARGQFVEERTRNYCAHFMQSFEQWIRRQLVTADPQVRRA